MSKQSIVEDAADVREKVREVKALCDDLRSADRQGDAWVSAEMAAEEALEIARSGLRHAWQMLDRIQRLIPKPTSEGGRDE